MNATGDEVKQVSVHEENESAQIKQDKTVIGQY